MNDRRQRNIAPEHDFYDQEDTDVLSPSGLVIDTSGDIWRLGADGVVAWDDFRRVDRRILSACRSFIRHLIRNNALTYTIGQHKFMKAMAKEPFVNELNRIIERDGIFDRQCYELFKRHVRKTVMICPPLSGPETMIVWTTKGTMNAEQEAQAGRNYRQAA
ncbi:hypothetical protein ACKU27_27175 [Sphingobium yanoikuyae]|uniref:hypothetical protein n=1 Tax=Sphingobium yanoikuyae TaxID=13690 RepID=UPI003B91B2D1